jgi:hypothetical protein
MDISSHSFYLVLVQSPRKFTAFGKFSDEEFEREKILVGGYKIKNDSYRKAI